MKCSYGGWIDIYNCYVFLLDGCVDHYIVSFLITCNVLYFKVYFVWYEDCYSSFLCFPFAWNIFFHPLTFSLYVSLDLKWDSCRRHICGCYFCIHSTRLYLLVRAFNTFTFKVIIDIYASMAIFLIVWGWFCRSFFFLVFLYYINTFNICCKAGLMVLNFLNFCWSGKPFISPSKLMEILAENSNLGCRFFPFSTLNIACHSLLACRVSVERSAVKHIWFPLYLTCCFSLTVFNILSLCLVFATLINMCLGMFLLGFIFYGTLCASWIWLTISFSMLGKFSALISSKIFSYLFFSLFFFGNPYNSNVGAFDIVP